MSTSLVPSGAIIKDESYLELLEEIRAAEAEHSFAERIERIYMYHDIGCLIRDYQKEKQLGVTAFIKELHLDLKYAERSLWFAKECAERWKTREELDANLPDGKATSWAKVKLMLGDENKTSDTLDLTKTAKGIIKRYGLETAQTIASLILSMEYRD